MSTIIRVEDLTNQTSDAPLADAPAAFSERAVDAPVPTPHPEPDPADHFLRLAYQRVQAEIRAYVVRDTDRMNADPGRVCTAVAGIFPALNTLRAQLISTINNFDVARFDRLPDYAHALYYCQQRHITASQPGPIDQALVARGTALRDDMFVASQPLVRSGIIPEVAVAPVKKVLGHRGLISDLTLLSQAFIDHRVAIAGRTTITNEDLVEAMGVVEKVEAAVGKRDVSPTEVSEARHERDQAFFLLVDVYENVRVSVSLVRHGHGDAELYTPSITARPPSTYRRGRGDEDEVSEPEGAPLAGPGATGVHPAVPASEGALPISAITPTTFAPGTFKRSGQ